MADTQSPWWAELLNTAMKVWGPIIAIIGAFAYLLATEMPRRDRDFQHERASDRDAFLSELKRRDEENGARWKLYGEQYNAQLAKFIQSIDLFSKTSLEQVYEMRRLREALKKE